MTDNTVSIRISESVARIALERPQQRNAISRSMIAELQQALFDAHQQGSVRSVVLEGQGDVFCAGMDLYEIYETGQSANAESQWQEDADAFRQLLGDMLVFPKPIIAAIDGGVHGGGAALVMASDIVIASARSTMSIPAPQRGLVAGLIAPLFAFRASAGYAARFMLTGETISSEALHRIGIIHELVPDATDLEARIFEFGRHFAQCSFESIAMTKRLINEEIGSTLRAQLAVGAAMTATSKTTEAGREGVRKFVEGRPES